jgi:hypothetical protein
MQYYKVELGEMGMVSTQLTVKSDKLDVIKFYHQLCKDAADCRRRDDMTKEYFRLLIWAHRIDISRVTVNRLAEIFFVDDMDKIEGLSCDECTAMLEYLKEAKFLQCNEGGQDILAIYKDRGVIDPNFDQ